MVYGLKHIIPDPSQTVVQAANPNFHTFYIYGGGAHGNLSLGLP